MCLVNPYTEDTNNLFDYQNFFLYWQAIWTYGELAQLGERLNGIQEVSGSIPLFSTLQNPHTAGFVIDNGKLIDDN